MLSLAKSLALLTFLAPAARADGFGISFSNSSKHGAFSIGYSSAPFLAPSLAPSHRIHPRPARWVNGHYATVRERVWVPGRVYRRWVEPAYAWRRIACGELREVCIAPGHYETVKEPGRYEMRDVRVWVEGGYRY